MSDVPKIRLTWTPSEDSAWLSQVASAEAWNSGWTQFLRIRREKITPESVPLDAPPAPLPNRDADERARADD